MFFVLRNTPERDGLGGLEAPAGCVPAPLDDNSAHREHGNNERHVLRRITIAAVAANLAAGAEPIEVETSTALCAFALGHFIPFLTTADLARHTIFLEARIAACLTIVLAFLVMTLVRVRRKPIAGVWPINAHGRSLAAGDGHRAAGAILDALATIPRIHFSLLDERVAAQLMVFALGLGDLLKRR